MSPSALIHSSILAFSPNRSLIFVSISKVHFYYNFCALHMSAVMSARRPSLATKAWVLNVCLTFYPQTHILEAYFPKCFIKVQKTSIRFTKGTPKVLFSAPQSPISIFCICRQVASLQGKGPDTVDAFKSPPLVVNRFRWAISTPPCSPCCQIVDMKDPHIKKSLLIL